MILVATEDALPAAVRVIKQDVLLCLQTAHSLHEYSTVSELTAFLDENLTAAKLPGLTRVVLFYRDPLARLEVERRMAPDGQLSTFLQPQCWRGLAMKLPELHMRARRLEPVWFDEQLRLLQLKG